MSDLHIQIKDCVAYIKEELHCLGAYVVYNSDSEVSFKFADPKLGSLRLACVPSDYQYRWNLTCGDFVKVPTKYKSHWYDIEEAHHFVERIKKYAATIARNEEAKEKLGSFITESPVIDKPSEFAQQSIPLEEYDDVNLGETDEPES